MKKPALVVLAAGMGSRYGGMKQLDPVGNHGQLIIDYSIYDAYRAGFDTVVFIIKKEFEELFRSAIGDRIASYMNVKYAYQRADDLPEGYRLPADRVKPWGTAHAVMAARDVLDGPFAVINADDYYGVSAFRMVYDFLTTTQDDPRCHNYCLVGYLLKNTVTENGSVARGVCQADENGILHPCSTDTGIFIYPGYKFKITDALITNFHLPESTLLMLVSAFAGREKMLNAYKLAVSEHYRFFSFGDAMFII